MKKIYFLLVISILSLQISNAFAKDIESILKIKPDIKYDENLKYEEINKYSESKDNDIKLNYDFDIHVDYNKELKTIEGIKIDVGTNF